MIGTSFETMGGVTTVVRGYRDAGLFERCDVVYLASHQDGSFIKKFRIAVACFFRLLFLLSNNSVKLAHLHVASRQSFWRKSILLTICRLFGVRTILHLHGAEFMMFYGEESGRIVKRCVNYIFDHADHLIVLSPQWRVDAAGFTTNKNISVIYNAVRLPESGTAADSNHNPRIAFLGRLGKRKGVFDLLKAFQKVLKEYPECQLECAGDGDLDTARSCADKLGLGGSVIMPGWIGAEEREQLLERATLFVLPSYAEGLPMSLLEAMAAGLPVITTRVGGIPDVVTDGVEGILIDAGDIAALEASLLSVLADENLRRSLGGNGRKRIVQQFSIGQAVEKVEALYNEVLSR